MPAQGTEIETTAKPNKSNKFFIPCFLYFFDFAVRFLICPILRRWLANPRPSQITRIYNQRNQRNQRTTQQKKRSRITPLRLITGQDKPLPAGQPFTRSAPVAHD
jgi:hypothetical protein